MRIIQWLAVTILCAEAVWQRNLRRYSMSRSRQMWRPARSYATAPTHRIVPIRKWRRPSGSHWLNDATESRQFEAENGNPVEAHSTHRTKSRRNRWASSPEEGSQSSTNQHWLSSAHPNPSDHHSSASAHRSSSNGQHWFDKRQPKPQLQRQPSLSSTLNRHPTVGQTHNLGQKSGKPPAAHSSHRPALVSRPVHPRHSKAASTPAKPQNPRKSKNSAKIPKKPAVANMKFSNGKKYISIRIKRVEPDVPPDVKRRILAKMARKSNTSSPAAPVPAGFHSEVLSRQVTIPQHIRSRGISFIDIALGTPPQPMRVVLDTGSDELWVARAQGCQDEGTPKAICSCQTFHEPSSSTTILPDKLDIQYGSGFVKGVYADDSNFILGDPKCKTKMQVDGKFKFGLGEQHQGMSEMSGILGMCFPLPPKQYVNPGEAKGDSLMEQLMANGMDGKFSTYVKRCNPPAQGNRCKDGGILTLGRHDSLHCGKEITTVSIKNFRNPGSDQELPFASHWSFDADGIWMEMPDGKAETSMKDKKFTTITDSGTSGMLVPGDLFDRFRALLPNSCEDQGQFKFCPCDIDFSVKVKINGVTIPIHARDMMLTASSDGKACQVLFMRSDDEFIFGDPFVRTVCHHHFWKEKKITFAALK